MDRHRLLGLVARLGREFVRRGMDDHARRLRVYYLALRHGLVTGRNALDVRWDEAFTLEWLALLGLPPHAGDYDARPRPSRCRTCPQDRDALRTLLVLPDGAKVQCQTCGATWVERDPPPR